MNESLLTDGAFLPKAYTTRLEKGSFLTTYDAILSEEEGQCTPRFALRLEFDMSAFPPRHGWKEPDGASDAVRMWDWKSFYSRQLPELKTQGHTRRRSRVVR